MIIFFFLGILLTIIGWFFDKASNFSWLIKLISRDAYFGLNALDFLAENINGMVCPEHSGFKAILSYWPQLSSKTSVRFIRRGPAFLKFSSQVGTGFALVAYDAEQKQIESGWEETEARKFFRSKLDIRLFRYGAVIFFIGILVALVSWLLEFMKR